MGKTGLILLVISLLILNGCMVIFQKGRRSDFEKIEVLESELNKLQEASDLLKSRLAQEIEDKQVRLAMAEKGLVITFVAEVLFDSGKAKLRIAPAVYRPIPGNTISSASSLGSCPP